MGVIQTIINGERLNDNINNIVEFSYTDDSGIVQRYVVGVIDDEINSKLPKDVLISISGGKNIVSNQVIDGNIIYERVSTRPFDITLSFTLRQLRKLDNPPNKMTAGILKRADYFNYITPIDNIGAVIDIVFKPNRVLKISNPIINKIGITEVILTDIDLTTVRGDVDMPCTLKLKENYYNSNVLGYSLIVE